MQLFLILMLALSAAAQLAQQKADEAATLAAKVRMESVQHNCMDPIFAVVTWLPLSLAFSWIFLNHESSSSCLWFRRSIQLMRVRMLQ